MKNLMKSKNLPYFAVGCGAVGFLLRWMLYAFAVDQKNLLPVMHPLEVLLWLLTAAVVVRIVLSVRKLDGSNRFVDNFRPSVTAAAGHVLAAAGILLTMLLNEPGMGGALGRLWTFFGWVSVPCMVLAGVCRMQGKRPFFLLHMAACLFLVFHIVNHYQAWSGNPQLQDYVFHLFGCAVLMLFAFYQASFDVGSGRRRMQLATGLLAVYLCCVALSAGDYPFLYVGGIAWAMTDLCPLKALPRTPRPAKEGE